MCCFRNRSSLIIIICCAYWNKLTIIVVVLSFKGFKSCFLCYLAKKAAGDSKNEIGKLSREPAMGAGHLAFLGPDLWGNTRNHAGGEGGAGGGGEDFHMEYMDLEEFLLENGFPIDGEVACVPSGEGEGYAGGGRNNGTYNQGGRRTQPAGNRPSAPVSVSGAGHVSVSGAGHVMPPSSVPALQAPLTNGSQPGLNTKQQQPNYITQHPHPCSPSMSPSPMSPNGSYLPLKAQLCSPPQSPISPHRQHNTYMTPPTQRCSSASTRPEICSPTRSSPPESPRIMSPGPGLLSPRPGQLSPRSGLLSPGPGLLSPGPGQLSPGSGQLSPGRGQLSPRSDQLTASSRKRPASVLSDTKPQSPTNGKW